MSGLSEVSILFGQRAGDIEKAREIFAAESRSFVTGILGGLQRARPDPWVAPRVRIDLPREIETEPKATYLRNQYAAAPGRRSPGPREHGAFRAAPDQCRPET